MKKTYCKFSRVGLIAGFSLGMVTGGTSAATLNLSNTPLFLANQVKPNVMVMLDNSGSMKHAMYEPGFGSVRTGFNPATSYYGMFDASKSYVYDPTIPVNTGAYTVTIDPGVAGAFVESNCTPAQGEQTCWSGSYLNWLTTRRMDATRAVLIGGKLESRTSYNYGSGLNYKLVANNERDDRSFGGSYTASGAYSPIPDNQVVTVVSPANSGNILATYDPYAKIVSGGSGLIYSDAGTVIGEFGQVATDENWETVSLVNTYADPVVVAKPPTISGGDPSVVRIKSVVGTSFQIQVQEYNYRDGGHTDETMGYVVIESGTHTLDGGVQLIAETVTTDKTYVDGNCGTAQTGSDNVSFSSAFSSTPVVVSSVMTATGSDAVNSRTWNIDANGFDLAMQEEENEGGHGTETVGYIAVESGVVNDSTNQFILEAGTQSSVDENVDTISYTTAFTSTPVFVAAIQSMADSDTAVLRVNSNSQSSAQLHVQEEKSCDNEVNHADEQVGYLALQGASLSLNIALAVANEPTGLLHDVDSDVQMGISFYRYDPDSNDIYTGEKMDGGTIKFKIPKNPFVKKPTDTGLPAVEQGYRELTGYVGTSVDNIVDTIEHYPLVWGTTPIAENLWEVVQYFEQDTPYYPDMITGFQDYDLANAGNPERDPYYSPTHGRKLMCMRSNVLIFTDGEPYRDANVPSSVVDYDEDTDADDVNSTDPNDHGRDNLDDVGYWAYCDKSGGSCTGGADGSRDLRNDIAGDQYLRIDTVGFADGTIKQILQDTADNAGGTAYAAEDGLALKNALTAAFNQSISIGSASAVATNSTRLDTNTLIYQARFDSSDWSGQLLAFDIDDTDGSIAATPTWNTDTAGLIPAFGSRSIYSYNSSATPVGIDFTWANLDTTTQQPTLRMGAETDDTLAQARVSYLRGDSSNEVQNGGSFRNRTKLMGDIINSNPWFVGTDNFGYSDLPGTEGSSYDSYLTSSAGRTKVLYVGSNDGMLHAINAATGAELFAYVPGSIIPELKNLTDPDYGKGIQHQYFVDGSPRAGDVYFSSSTDWRTVLVGTMGGGARAVYALDVTDPDNFDADDVLWEFTNSSTDGADLGYTLTEATIARMANGKWAAIIGNGYNSDNGHAVLYILDIETGSVIKKIDTQAGSTLVPNGLATPIPIDDDGDHIVDAIYAGDLLGNMWKFDVDASNPSSWGSAFGTNPAPAPLYVAKDANGVVQPITAKPQVGLHPNGGVMVYFGTGKYFETTDNIVGVTPQIQTYYGIRDDFANGNSTPVVGRTPTLVEQTIDAEATAFGIEVRVTSDNNVDYTSKEGWFMDIKSPTLGGQGERVISPSLLRGDRLIFTTVIPSGDPCASGGTSWLMELDAVTGARLSTSPFDINGDGTFTTADLVQILDTNNDGVVDSLDEELVVSGKKSTIGIIKTPSVISAGTKEYKYTSGSSGSLESTTESSGINSGRQSWRQLR